MDAQATFSCSCTQSDLGPAAELPNLLFVAGPEVTSYKIGWIWPSKSSLGLNRSQSWLNNMRSACKFLYQQADAAREEGTHAFKPKPKDEDVLFHLPVTKAWLRQLVLELVLVGHAPYRAVVELDRDLFDW